MSLAKLLLVGSVAALISVIPAQTQEPKFSSPPAAQEHEIAVLDDDERLLDSAGLSHEGPGLLEFFRARARAEAKPGHVDDLVRRLIGPSLEDRVQASADLVQLGPLAIAGLRRVVNDLEAPDVREQARRLLGWVEGPQSANLAAAVARVVARRKPAGATEVLLAYLPFADNEDVAREVTTALGAVAVADGKPDPVLVRALSDSLPLRRLVAAAVLSQTAPGERQAVEKLLTDPNPEVRLGAALSLAKAHHAPAVPVLIDLLAVLPVNKRTQAEEILTELAGEWAPGGGPVAEDEIARRIRRDAWAAWWANTDGPALQEMLKKRTLPPAEQAKVKETIRRLADKSYPVREKAVVELIARGRVILPMLREALKDSELEIVRRAQRCIQRIEEEPANRLPLAALRILGMRKPPGAAESLLAYLPFAEEETLAETQSALALVALKDGKPEPALLRALTDAQSFVRATAGEALAQGGGPDARPAVRKLLEDADLSVRLRVALALAPRDAQAVPVLIGLMADVQNDQAWQIHDFLAPLAGDKAPPIPENNAESRKQASAAWAVWWKDNAGKVDLAKLASPQQDTMLGHIVICEHSTGRIVELGRDRKPRWSFSGTGSPVDVWPLPNNRVLVAEYGSNRVSERDIKGAVIWQKQMNGSPHNVQRLPNGHTFMCSNVQMVEVDRNGKEVFMLNNPLQNQGQLTGAYKGRDGQIVCMSGNGVCSRIDAKGKLLKSFQTNLGNAWFDVMPNGRIVVSQNGGSRLAEFDANGKRLLEINVPNSTTVTGLPNGNFLVSCHGNNRVLEMDRRGQTVWEYQIPNPFRARGR